MDFVAGPLNGVRLDNLLHASIDDAICVRAAVAYANWDNMELFEACKRAGKALTFYGRYDHTVPVHPEVLRWFLVQKSPDLVCKLVPDILHAKVIWWEGVGAYIGSANLSGRAWHSNIEAGVFIEQDGLVADELEDELVAFFAAIEAEATDLNEPLYKHICDLHDSYQKLVSSADAAARKAFNVKRKIPQHKGLSYVSKASALDRRCSEFLKEWNATLKTMNDIAHRVSLPQNRPNWIPENTPTGLQADQFLHAYYYQKVVEGNAHPFDRYFQQNKNRRDAALTEELLWWKTGVYRFDDELSALGRAPTVQAHLSKTELLNLDVESFVEVGSSIYAMRDYAFRKPPVSIGLASYVTNYELKAEAFARTQYCERSAKGRSILETIYFVLYGRGGDGDVAYRIWEAVNSPDWKITGMGLSTLGEIVGWALPEKFPPRNGRSSKALRALGNDVRIYT